MSGTVGHEWSETFDLRLCLENRFMCAAEIVEMIDQRVYPGFDIEGFQHVRADEVRKIANGFHGNRLVKEFQRLVILDAEAPTKIGTIRRKAVEYFAPGLA